MNLHLDVRTHLNILITTRHHETGEHWLRNNRKQQENVLSKNGCIKGEPTQFSTVSRLKHEWNKKNRKLKRKMKTRGLSNADMLKELTKLENGLKHLQHKLNYKNNNMAPNHTPVPFSTAKTDLVSQRRNMHCILEEISRRQGSSSTSAIKEKRISVRKSQCKCLFHFIHWCKKKKKKTCSGVTEDNTLFPDFCKNRWR